MFDQPTPVIISEQEQVEYRDVPGYPGYRVGDDGSVWSCWTRGRKQRPANVWRRLSLARGKKGYLMITLCPGRNYFYVHRLVLEVFIGSAPDGTECCHNDGCRTNNSLANLRWDTPKNNQADSVRHGTRSRGTRNGHAKLTEDAVRRIRVEYAADDITQENLGKKYGVSLGTINHVVNGTCWGWLADEGVGGYSHPPGG